MLTFTCIYPYVCGRIGLYPAKIMHFSDTWMFYAVAGGYLGSLPQQSCKKGRWIPGLGVALGILGVYHYGAEGYTLNEEHPALLLLAVSIFAMGKCMAGGKASPAWLAALVKTMLGVYIIHPVYIHLCLRLVKFNPQHHMPALTLPLTVAAIYAMSVMTVHLLRRIPPVRKYLL